jgi:hypothetical protein
MFWTGWVITGLISTLLTMSGVMKLIKAPPVLEGFAKFGFPESTIVGIGIVELACVVLYLIPQTAVLGAILLTGYLGGAVVTHLRVADPYFGPILIGAAMWLGIYLRDARLRSLVPLRSAS